MRRLTIPGVFLLFVMALVLRPVSLVGQDQQAGKNIQKARAMVVIVGNPLRPDGTAPPDDAMNALILHWLAAHPEAEQPRDFAVVAFHHLSVSPDGNTLGEISVQGRAKPDEMLTFVEEVLNHALQEIYDQWFAAPYQQELMAASKREDRAMKRVEELADFLRARQATAREQGVALEPDDPQLLASVRRDSLALRAELAGLRAQQRAITEQIYVATDKLSAGKADEDLIRAELQKVLELRRDELARVAQLVQSGHAAEHDVAQAEVAVAKAQSDLAEFRRAQAQQSDSGTLGRLNERLVETQIAITTAEARLEETERAIERLRQSAFDPAHPLVIEIQLARRELESVSAEHQAAAAQRARLSAAGGAHLTPKVTVIRKEADAK